MKTVPCRSCQHQVAPNAVTCPSCGASRPGTTPLTMGLAIGISVMLMIAFGSCVWSIMGPPPADPATEAAIRRALGSVVDQDDVAWLAVDRSDAIVGFHERPSDLDSLLAGWAFSAAQEAGDRVTVWAVPASYGRQWRPDTSLRDRVYGYHISDRPR